MGDSDDEAPCDIFHPCGRLRLELMQEEAAEAIQGSLREARSTRWDSVRSPHLFMGLLATADGTVSDWVERLGADLPRLLDQFRELFHQECGEPEPMLKLHREFLSDSVIRVLREAYFRSADHRRDQVSPLDLLISLFTTPNSIVAECFEKVGVTAARLTELAVLVEQQARQH
jgi:ATP-dependent Clp protease ATP-binding subunit ClpA